MRFSLLVLLVAVTASFAFPPVPPPKKAKPKEGELSLKALEGTWTVVSYEVGRAKNAKGKVLAVKSSIVYDKVEIKDGKWVQKRNLPKGGTSQTVPYTILLDTTKSPPTFDLTNSRVSVKAKAAKTKASTREGVVRLEGDQLTVTYSAAGRERPASAEAELTTGQYRWVLKRARP